MLDASVLAAFAASYYGAPDRLRTLASDLVRHWDARSAEMRKFIGMPGKGMIVCATREICAKLYEQLSP